MRILNYGSLNIDYVYKVDHISKPGETLSSSHFQIFAGGKGNNQSIALARAGANIHHAGKVGKEGAWLAKDLQKAGASVEHIKVADSPSGHAIIQVEPSGENSIVLFGGSNREILDHEVIEVISAFSKGDILLLQNEVNNIPHIMRTAHKREMRIFLNPAPFDAQVLQYPLDLVECMIVNETEAEGLTGTRDIEEIIGVFERQFSGPKLLLTLGKMGAIYHDAGKKIEVSAPKVEAVDTTAAGDCFIGYFLASIARNMEINKSLEVACKAAAISVTRKGAAVSIPALGELVA